IAVEGRDLDRRHLLDLGEAAPETRGEGNAADRRLQIESDERDGASELPAMRDQLVLARPLHGAKAQEPGVIAEADRGLRFPPRPPAATQARRALPRGWRIAWREHPPPGRRPRHRGSSG